MVHGPARHRPRRRAAGHLSSPLFVRPPLRGGRPGAPGAHFRRPPPRAWVPRRVSPALHAAHRRRSRRASRSPSRPAHPRPTPRGLGWTDAASGLLFDPGPTPTQPSRAVGRGVATTIIRRTSAPPGSPAAEDSGALIVGRMMPVSKPFLLHARGHRAQLRTPHPVLVLGGGYVCLLEELSWNSGARWKGAGLAPPGPSSPPTRRAAGGDRDGCNRLG
jgi:hypothetical protein